MTHMLPASTGRRTNRLLLTAGDPLVLLLDLPSTDGFLSSGGLQVQRGHVLIRLVDPVAGVGARRTVEWRLTTSAGSASAFMRGKIGSSAEATLVEAPRQGGVVLPVEGGFRLEVSPFTNTAATTMAVEAMYSPGGEANAIPTWPTAYALNLLSGTAVAPAPPVPGAWVELGPPPFGTTRWQAVAPDVGEDASAPGPVECEWLNADGTRAALQFLNGATPLQEAPQGFHARLRTSVAYNGSGFTASVLWTWS